MTFKDYINEGTSKAIFQKMSSGDIPLTPKMLERIFTINKDYFFHVTDLTNTKRLEKLQKLKKQVSCFTDFKNIDIFSGADGIDYTYPCTFILYGSYTFGSSEDFYTEPDNAGRRWIQYYEISDTESYNLFEEISNEIVKLFMHSKFGKEFTPEQISLLFDTPSSLNGKTKQLIIKTYMDCAEKAIIKFKDDIIYLFERETEKYNEVMGYNFIIKDKIMLYKDFTEYLYRETNTTEYIDYSYQENIKLLDNEAKKMGIILKHTKEDISKSLYNY